MSLPLPVLNKTLSKIVLPRLGPESSFIVNTSLPSWLVNLVSVITVPFILSVS